MASVGKPKGKSRRFRGGCRSKPKETSEAEEAAKRRGKGFKGGWSCVDEHRGLQNWGSKQQCNGGNFDSMSAASASVGYSPLASGDHCEQSTALHSTDRHDNNSDSDSVDSPPSYNHKLDNLNLPPPESNPHRVF